MTYTFNQHEDVDESTRKERLIAVDAISELSSEESCPFEKENGGFKRFFVCLIHMKNGTVYAVRDSFDSIKEDMLASE